MKERICITCGKSFTPRCGTHTHCNECSGEKHTRTYPQTFTCEWCGKVFVATNGHHHRFCSRTCFGKERSSRKIPKKPKEKSKKTCERCGSIFVTSLSSQKYCSRQCCNEENKRQHREQWAKDYIPKTYICKECGTAFTTECGNTHSVFCCLSCADKNARRIEHKSARHKEYMRGARLRRDRQIAEAFVEKVSYEEIFRRDSGICRICGLPVLKDKHLDQNWSGSIDHIVPISKGGEHSMSNCQLAHRICNSLKCQETGSYSIDWDIKGQENNYWKKKFEVLKSYYPRLYQSVDDQAPYESPAS